MQITIVILNFCVDWLLLQYTDQLLGVSSHRLRLIGAAIFGSVWCGISLIPRFSWTGAAWMHLVFLALTSVIAYGRDWKRCSIFLLIVLALEGAVGITNERNIIPLILCGLGIWLLSCIAFRGAQLVPVEIFAFGKNVKLTGLRDTGNVLRDPVSGDSVLVIGWEPASILTGLSRKELADPLNTMLNRKNFGFRLIPYKTVEQNHGLMLAMRVPKLKIGNRVGPGVVGFAASGLGGTEYQALTGGTL